MHDDEFGSTSAEVIDICTDMFYFLNDATIKETTTKKAYKIIRECLNYI